MIRKFFFAVLIFMTSGTITFAQQSADLMAEVEKAYAADSFDLALNMITKAGENMKTEKYWLKLGDIFQKKEDYPEAIKAYNEALRQNKQCTEAMIHRGSARIWSEQVEEGIKDLNRALKSAPRNYLAHYYLGVAYYQQFKTLKAISALNRCIELNPDYAPAFYLRGAAQAELVQYDEAISSYQRASALDSTLHAAQYNVAVIKFDKKDYQGALEMFNEIAEQTDAFKADVMYFRGETHFYLNDKQAACIDYRAAAKLGDEVAAGIYDKYCLKGFDRKSLPARQTESISL